MANWKDIQDRAEKFVLSYADAKDEDRDAKPFWKDLLELYGVEPRQVGAFEERVRIHGRPGVGRIDYFAPGKFIIEHKSLGKDLDGAFKQAMDYFDALPKSERPQYILVSDFGRIRVYDLLAPEESRLVEFALTDLPKRVKSLAFFAEEEVRVYKPEEPIDVKAVRAIGKLHAALKTSNYNSNQLSALLTRIVFCCFADDTGIFENGSLLQYLEENTKPDGSDIGGHLNSIFEILNTPESARQSNIHSSLENLPYVNGGLFAETLNVVFASREIRDTLLKCMEFNWSLVSPAIFGSMFQSVMDGKQRHDLGAHYTSETNILKVINGLFLEELQAELVSAKTSREKLLALQDKVCGISLLDPACGCGNFLVVAYRELRRIENEIIARLHKKAGVSKVDAGHMVLPMDVDIKKLSMMSVERMYGIEIDSFPAEVAKLSLWLMDHKMNVELGAYFGKPFKKLPLTEAPHIVQGNALRMDWESVVPKEKLTYILGNPPFLGHHLQNVEQKAELTECLHNLKTVGVMDYVAGWYVKAAEFVQGTEIRSAFVSTNSITQGEQVGILWGDLLFGLSIKIHFAHQTFKWSNEATGKAAVYCVIIGFGTVRPHQARLYVYADIRGEPIELLARNINPYLIDAPNVVIRNRRSAISEIPEMQYGNKPTDGGNFLLTDSERSELLQKEPNAATYVKRFLGAEDFLNGETRWCIWLKDIAPEKLREMPEVMRHIEAVRMFRSLSKAATTRDYPHHTLFRQITQPKTDYVLVPIHTSETRNYIPMGFFTQDVIVANSCMAISGASLYHFGVLESEMHMAWMRAVAGRLKSDYRYSKDIVYNNYPWPVDVSDAQKKAVADAAQVVLDTRAKYPNATLADLYDPNTMPADLLAAHKALDKAVDACYGKKVFKSEPERLEFLFERYQALIAQEAATAPKKQAKRAKRAANPTL